MWLTFVAWSTMLNSIQMGMLASCVSRAVCLSVLLFVPLTITSPKKPYLFWHWGWFTRLGQFTGQCVAMYDALTVFLFIKGYILSRDRLFDWLFSFTRTKYYILLIDMTKMWAGELFMLDFVRWPSTDVVTLQLTQMSGIVPAFLPSIFFHLLCVQCRFQVWAL